MAGHNAPALRRSDRVLHETQAKVSSAAYIVERRWSPHALRRVNPELSEKLEKQKSKYSTACVTGSDNEVQTHGDAMVRGYFAALKALEASGEPDDVYFLGQSKSGLRIAIGNLKAAADRVSEVCGNATIFLTADEVAEIVAGLELLKSVKQIKQFFPGAEVVDVRPGEPDKVADRELVAMGL